MTLDRLNQRFPDGETVLRSALRREGVSTDGVDMRLAYTGVSWTLHVTCDRAGYRRVAQLAPEDLRPDTAWHELCDDIAEDLARAIHRSSPAGEEAPWLRKRPTDG